MNFQLLDNPIWSAMISSNNHLSEGDELARHFPQNISPFAGLKHFNAECFQRLSNLSPVGTVRATFTPTEIEVDYPWRVRRRMQILQMVHKNKPPQAPVASNAVTLGNKDVSEMVALTALTNPGPFKEKTIDFGNYYGIRQDGRLVSMAGFRLQTTDFTEISAVCTHPDYTGNGYARMLLHKLINDIYAENKTPVLHVKRDYAAAIKLYESVGFEAHQHLHVVEFEKV